MQRMKVMSFRFSENAITTIFHTLKDESKDLATLKRFTLG